MEKIKINEKEYQIIKNEKDAIDFEILSEKLTDYFYGYDYILGDWAYGKLRLKGFNDKGSKLYKPLNDIAGVDKYIKQNCAYGCRHFILKKVVK